MNAFANSIKNDATTTRTENGALTYSTSLNANVDMFFQIGAIRGQGADRVRNVFRAAYTENPDLATRVALWARDARDGAGERETFRNILRYLEEFDKDRLKRIMPLIPVVGRFDDLFIFKTDEMKQLAYIVFGAGLIDEKTSGLAAKWAPRETGSKKAIARELMKAFNLSPWEYRKMIVSLSNTVEQKMSAKLWDEIDFSHVPSIAASRYAKAFRRNQEERYNEFVQAALKGEVKINTSVLFPHEVTKPSIDRETANALWKNLPDYVPEGKSILPMIDTSGSMQTPAGGNSSVTCLDVSVAIGIYLAERNKTAFNRLGLTFESSPKFIQVPKTDDIRTKVEKVRNASWGGSTNLDAAMRLIVDHAVRNNIPQEDMPDYLVVLSDMEFNANVGGMTNAKAATKYFNDNGYKAPNIVWWNIQSRNGNIPVRAGEKGMALVSGFSPTIIKTVLSGDVDPVSVMLRTVDVEKYNH